MACTAEPPLEPPAAAPPNAHDGQAAGSPQAAASRPVAASPQRSTINSRPSALLELPVVDPDVATRLERSLSERLTHSVDGLPRRTLPGVGEVVDTRGRFQHVVVQTRDATGRARTECFESQAELRRALGNTPADGASR